MRQACSAFVLSESVDDSLNDRVRYGFRVYY